MTRQPPAATRSGSTSRKLGAGSVHQIHAILSGALEQAVKWEWIDRNVAKLASPPKIRRQPIRPPTVAAVRALVAASASDPVLSMAVRLAVATGARRGELCALRWSDVDLEAGVVRIARAVVEVKGRGTVEKATKSYDGRLVAIDAGTVEELKRFKETRCTPGMNTSLPSAGSGRMGASTRMPISTTPSGLSSATTAKSPTTSAPRITASPTPDTYVLSRTADRTRPWTPSNLSACWAKHCAAQGAKGIRFHDLRHWSVTTALDAGVPLAAVAARHGHRDANITLGVYGHAVDGRDRQTAELIGRALGPTPLVSTDG